MSDSLVEIPDEDLPNLRLLYQERAPWAPYMVSFIHTAIKWKKSPKYNQALRFLSPQNCWKNDGTIIATITLQTSRDIVVFTLDDECTNLYKGLNEANFIRPEKGVKIVFYFLHKKHIPTVHRFLQEKKINIRLNVPCSIYSISPEKAKNFIIECPPEVYIQKLEPSSAKQINDVWPHKFPNSEQYLASFIEMNGGYGIYLKSTNAMVAWVIKQTFGHLAMLQTEEGFQRKGYASLVTKVLSKEIAEEGHCPLGSVLVQNKKSMAMFEKLGFSNIGGCTFTLLEKYKDASTNQ